MDKLIIRPYVGVDKVKLGMTSEEVHEAMGRNFTTHKNDGIKIDEYYQGDFQVNYDENDIVNFIQIVRCITDYCQVVFNEIDVFRTKAEDLVAYLEKIGKNNDDDVLGYLYIFEDVGIALWRSSVFREDMVSEPWFQEMSEENKKEEYRWLYFETVAVFSKGYYDGYFKLTLENMIENSSRTLPQKDINALPNDNPTKEEIIKYTREKYFLSKS